MESTSSAARAESFLGAGKPKKDPVADSVQVADVSASAQKGQASDIKGADREALAPSTVAKKTDAVEKSFFGTPATPTERAARSSRYSSDDGAPDSVEMAISSLKDDPKPEKKVAAPQTQDGRYYDTPEVNAQGQASVEQRLPPIESLVVYNLEQPTPKSSDTADQLSAQNGFRIPKYFLPKGELVPVYLMNDVQTGHKNALVEFAVAKTIWFNGRPVLPFGTRFLAKVDDSAVRDRMSFEIESLRRRDGVSMPVTAVVLGPDRFNGLQGYYVPPTAMAQIAPYLADFSTSFAELVKEQVTSRQQSVAEIAANAAANAAANGGVAPSTQRLDLGSSAQEAALYASSKALGEFIDRQVGLLEERYAPYVYLLRGTVGYVQLRSDTDLGPMWAPIIMPESESVSSTTQTLANNK